jgi:hypothetical protein
VGKGVKGRELRVQKEYARTCSKSWGLGVQVPPHMHCSVRDMLSKA